MPPNPDWSDAADIGQPTRARPSAPVPEYTEESQPGLPTRARLVDDTPAQPTPIANDCQWPPQCVLDRYEIVEALPPGGMGQVFKVRDKRLKRLVALKCIRPEFAGNKPAVERFFLEAQAVAALNHPHIVVLHDFNDSVPYLTMEFIEGGDLASRLRAHGPLKMSLALGMMVELCDALQAAHQHSAGSILHRDLKPANVLLHPKRDGTLLAKLCDFGLACMESTSGHTQTGAVLGTLDYMSPEQRRGERATSRSDQWSLAATFYEMLTGKPPRVIREGQIPELLRAPLLRALEDNPDDRFESIESLGQALAGIAKDRSPLPNARRETPATFTPKPVVLPERSVSVTSDKIPPSATATADKNHDRFAKPAEPVKPLEPRVTIPLVEERKNSEANPLIAPFGTVEISEARQRWASALKIPETFSNSIGMTFQLIPPGQFEMGPSFDEDLSSSDLSKPTKIKKPFFCGTFPVTQSQFTEVMGVNPSAFQPTGRFRDQIGQAQNGSFPVEQVSVEQIGEFLRRLSERDSPSRNYRLLTEEEWEYACRAGTTMPFYFGMRLNGQQANCLGTKPEGTPIPGPELRRPSFVGFYKSMANAFGLHDMLGNVWEVVSNPTFRSRVLSAFAIRPAEHVCRGGSWNEPAQNCRCSSRRLVKSTTEPDIGFRVACDCGNPNGDSAIDLKNRR